MVHSTHVILNAFIDGPEVGVVVSSRWDLESCLYFYRFVGKVWGLGVGNVSRDVIICHRAFVHGCSDYLELVCVLLLWNERLYYFIKDLGFVDGFGGPVAGWVVLDPLVFEVWFWVDGM